MLCLRKQIAVKGKADTSSHAFLRQNKGAWSGQPQSNISIALIEHGNWLHGQIAEVVAALKRPSAPVAVITFTERSASAFLSAAMMSVGLNADGVHYLWDDLKVRDGNAAFRLVLDILIHRFHHWWMTIMQKAEPDKPLPPLRFLCFQRSANLRSECYRVRSVQRKAGPGQTLAPPVFRQPRKPQPHANRL